MNADHIVDERSQLIPANASRWRDVVTKRDAPAAFGCIDARRGGHAAIVAAMPIRQRRLTFEARA
jgi:hypothetical protein